jgi:hypothetical protein
LVFEYGVNVPDQSGRIWVIDVHFS